MNVTTLNIDQDIAKQKYKEYLEAGRKISRRSIVQPGEHIGRFQKVSRS